MDKIYDKYADKISGQKIASFFFKPHKKNGTLTSHVFSER